MIQYKLEGPFVMWDFKKGEVERTMTTNNISSVSMVGIAGVGSTKESDELFEVYTCGNCGTRRVWGHGNNASAGYVPPNPTPTLNCEGTCGGATPHTYATTRLVTTTRHYDWRRGRGGETEARVEGVKFRGHEGVGADV